MPDGGSDCCGTCIFNVHYASYHDPAKEGQRPYDGECRLRGITTLNPFWTYCDWWNGGWEMRREVRDIREAARGTFQIDQDRVSELIARILKRLSDDRSSFGPVYASGRWEDGYTRIPWDGPNEVFSGSSWTELHTCSVCGSQTEDYLAVAPRHQPVLYFDTNACYLKWWRTRHPEPEEPRRLR